MTSDTVNWVLGKPKPDDDAKVIWVLGKPYNPLITTTPTTIATGARSQLLKILVGIGVTD